VKDIADEIIIVDGGSTDKTVEIAKTFESTIIHSDNPANFHINKQKALDACQGEWILQLDADEEVSKELANEIKQIIDNQDNHHLSEGKSVLFHRHQEIVETRDHIKRPTDGPVNAYYLARKNYFLGKAMTYAGMYPDGVIRLVRKGKAFFPAKSVHEQIQIEGRVSWLASDLYHYSNPTLERYLTGAGKYTNLLAKEIVKEKNNNWVLFLKYCLTKPVQTFITLFFRHKGMLDGIHGFLFCLFSSLHYPVAFVKYLNSSMNPKP
jgi:glycosyltransferase involved in cell wall biosynthesis